MPPLLRPTGSRLTAYVLGSLTSSALVVLHASASRTTAFAVGVSLAKSSGAVMVLGNLAICASLLVGLSLQRLFFGHLRPIELEHLYDRTWYFLTESLLAFTMFREDFGLAFFSLFGALLALKCFHWIAADRIDYLDQLASPPRWPFHLRLGLALGLFLLPLDLLLLVSTARSLLNHPGGLLTNGGGRILFVSEFAVLLVGLAGSGGRYAIWGWDQARLAQGRRARAAERAAAAAAAAAESVGGPAEGEAGPTAPGEVEDSDEDDEDAAAEEDVWEGKSMVLFYLDLTTDFLKLVIYLVFFVVVLVQAGLPFNVLRDLYLTARSFLTRLRSLISYRRATADMERRYADATDAEVGEQAVCIICRDELREAARASAGRRAKRLGCGHAFHLRCLRMWLERQQSCPTCRRSVLGDNTPAPAPTPAAAAAAQPAPPPIGGPGAEALATFATDRLPPSDGPARAAATASGRGDDEGGDGNNRPLPEHLVRFSDHLAQHPPEPLQTATATGYGSVGGVQHQRQQQPTGSSTAPAAQPAATSVTATTPAARGDGNAASAGVGVDQRGLFGAPNPPERFAHLFPTAAPPPPPAPTTPTPTAVPGPHPPPPAQGRRRPPGVSFELNVLGLEIDLRFFFGAERPPPPPPPAVAAAAPSPLPAGPAAAVTPAPISAGRVHLSPLSSATPALAPALIERSQRSAESIETRLLRELSESMTGPESAAFTQVLTKIVDDAQRIEMGEELARARRADIREAVGRLASALHTRPAQIGPTAALFPLVLGEEVDLSLVPSSIPQDNDANSEALAPIRSQRLRYVDADGVWLLDLAFANTVWFGPDDPRLRSAEAAPTMTTAAHLTAPDAPAATIGAAVAERDDASDGGSALDETTMTAREVAARAALRRSARLNPSLSSSPPPPPAAMATATSAGPEAPDPQPLPTPSPAADATPPSSRIVELDDGSVFFTVPPPPTMSASTSLQPDLGERLSTGTSAPFSPVPTPSLGRPLVTLTPLHSSSPHSSSSFLPLVNAQPSNRSLPVSLSEGDLALLSAETREAVARRLALIDQIDGILGGLRTELARVQRSLDRPPAPAAAGGGPFEAFTRSNVGGRDVGVGRAASSSSSAKGKGRAAIEPQDVPLPVCDGDEV